MVNYKYKIRAHHGMCLNFYKGRGYSESFGRNMQNILEDSDTNPYVCIINSADSICSCCPNLENGICTSQQKVIKYDKAVLKKLNIASGTVMPFKDFLNAVNKNIILSGERENICGSCEWSSICRL